MKFYIIRHGETALNAKGYVQGWLDEPLNEAGREIAVLTGKGMRGIRFDGCITSPLDRARETVELVLKESGNQDVPIEEDLRLREIFLGEDEGVKLGQGKTSPEEAVKYFSDPFNFIGFPGGETVRQVCIRTQEFLKELALRDDGKTYLIGTHGCALRAMMNGLVDDPDNFWRGHLPYNCEVAIVETEGSVIRLADEGRVYYDKSLIVDRYA